MVSHFTVLIEDTFKEISQIKYFEVFTTDVLQHATFQQNIHHGKWKTDPVLIISKLLHGPMSIVLQFKFASLLTVLIVNTVKEISQRRPTEDCTAVIGCSDVHHVCECNRVYH